MAVNQLALSWKDHHNVLISVFENLLEKEALVDCTLAAEGKFLKAHRIVLSACSPYLEDLLNQENDKHPIVFLRDVNFDDLRALVEFVYSGQIKIPENRLVEFLKIAEALQIKGLGGVENKDVRKTLSKESEDQEPASPAPRKRRRRSPSHSSGSNSCDKSEVTPVRPVQRSEVQPSGESRLNDFNTGSINSQPHKMISAGVDGEVPKVKEEVILGESPPSSPIDNEPFVNESTHSEVGEEQPELEPKFEEVTFTEQFSDNAFNEDVDVRESLLYPLQQQPSSSLEYSGYSAGPVDGLAEEISAIVPKDDPQTSEGYGLMRQRGPVSAKGYASYEQASCSSGRLQEKGDIAAYTTGSPNHAQKTEHYQCSYCKKCFGDETLLRSHTYSHTGEKSYECSSCSARFNNLGSLKRHIRTHTGEKPYECPECLKTFSEPGNYKRHMRIHTGERPYPCTICPKRFKNSGNLAEHLRVHTGEKPYRCSICKKEFKRRTHLKLHYSSH